MTADLQQLAAWIEAGESEHIEFKEARNRFQFDELARYCVALANEGGGHIILGVSDQRPRRVVGSQAFAQVERTRRGLMERLKLRFEIHELHHPNGRVVVVDVPPRPIGVPIHDGGTYWMRSGDRLVAMPAERLAEIIAESGGDFSAGICPGATIADLDRTAIEEFRHRWIAKSENHALATLSPDQLLADVEATHEGAVTYAGIVLFGSRAAVGKFLGQAEVVFEYRSSDASGPAQDRKEFRQGFFSFHDDLWQLINLRNDKQHYQDGLFILDIPTFAERSVREAILNAISHRSYQLGGSIFIRQYPRRLEIVSPGGFPNGISVDNVLDRQNPRNRRIADIFTRCGLIERSGQGMNLMFEESIRESKPLPTFAGTDPWQVSLTLHGVVHDPNFVRFLEQVGQERLATFSTADFLLLGTINQEGRIRKDLAPRLAYLLEQGIVERVSRARFILSRRFYNFLGRRGTYTRKRGLDREQNKALLLKHIEDNQAEGSPLQDLLEVLPALSREQVKTLLRELRQNGYVHPVGSTKAARWHTGPDPSGFGANRSITPNPDTIPRSRNET